MSKLGNTLGEGGTPWQRSDGVRTVPTSSRRNPPITRARWHRLRPLLV